ncbi:MAG: hypothetical protein FJ215_01045 [Ignavibacteria bacterium]|nr:hypothetical protein [Ignavibacteria bacterium]
MLRVFTLLLICATLSFGQSKGHAVGYEIVKNPLGKLILKISVEVPDAGLHLGISLYPPNASNLLNEGVHYSFPIKPGIFVKELEINSKFEKGTFEAAVWSGKLTKEQCAPDDPVCQKLGFKHTGMASYLWGYLQTR